ncbi:(2Fe-2S)-binding protein [Bordetella sp. FB-8]|uniref:(2Fe-2S)-binding protein n=1 Tax=Bordetella sp. FB-8 TaxID=1159870 RepID=UPI0003772A38|nr:(2Fe-2S)-binding protein [Bordetella sp. FB-8]
MAEHIELDIDGRRVAVPTGVTVAAAIAHAMVDTLGSGVITRRSVSGALRGPLCGMGVCQECRVTINGRAHRLACQTPIAAGMRIETATDCGAPT